MTGLQEFTENDRRLLAALPYRTGLLISESDATGGDVAQAPGGNAAHWKAIVIGFVQKIFANRNLSKVIDARNVDASGAMEWLARQD